MKHSSLIKPFFYILLLLSSQSCTRNYYGYEKCSTCKDNDYQANKNDTTQIIYESLARTISQQLIPNFDLIKDKKNLFILDSYFLPQCSNQDTSAYQQYKALNSIPNRIGSTTICLKSLDELNEITKKGNTVIYALQIGYITIKGDTAITGMQTYPVRNVQSKRAIRGGGGTHYIFHKSNGKWFYIGTGFCQWIS